ncbi:MAG TPA: zinc-finger domain-containing protein [Arenimonas sp.]|nr:zinc-finger domain-containing protein [Arenimonas sp.]
MTRTPSATAGLAPANTERRVEVRRSELPLCCPSPDMALWNSHPRVYLPIEATGSTTCPYCGALYVLVE